MSVWYEILLNSVATGIESELISKNWGVQILICGF